MAEERPPPEDSHRHLRCRGMTSQGFALEIPILAALGGMTGEVDKWHDGKEYTRGKVGISANGIMGV